MHTKQSGPVQSEFYTFSPVQSIWSGSKNIHNHTDYLATFTLCVTSTCDKFPILLHWLYIYGDIP